MSVEIEGLESLQRCFNRMDGHLLEVAVDEVTQSVWENTIKRAAPHRDTGWMERNIYRDRKGAQGEVWIQNTYYAPFVHFGTRRGYKGDPFMWLAVKDTVKETLPKWRKERLCK